jgi:hypothetical protein
MKKLIVSVLMFLSTCVFGQANKDTVGNKIIEKKITIRDEVFEMKKVINDNNRAFLMELFSDTYLKNKSYFKETDLGSVSDLGEIKQLIVLISSIKYEESDSIKALCNKIIDFNNNYLTLFDCKEKVLSKKYDSLTVSDNLKKIQSLPALDSDFKLNKTKLYMLDLLKNYKENSALLKVSLDRLKKKIDQPALKPSYLKYEKDPKFKDYPYLVSVIVAMKDSVISYTDDDL